MPGIRYFHPIEVRYGDLDPQGHVNNARFLTYLEQARVNYVRNLGLWRGDSFLEIGFILADMHIKFRAPILFTQNIKVGACVARLGNKSLDMHYQILDADSEKVLATATSVLVTYDYHSGQTIPIPDHWRQAISQFEELENGSADAQPT